MRFRTVLRPKGLTEQLCSMYRDQTIHDLQLQEYSVLHEEIGAEALNELDALMDKTDDRLPLNVQSSPLEHRRERYLVDRLEQITTQMVTVCGT